jgi:hypothetical protein
MEAFIKKISSIVMEDHSDIKEIPSVLINWKARIEEAEGMKNCLTSLAELANLDQSNLSYKDLIESFKIMQYQMQELLEFTKTVSSIFDSEINDTLLDEINDCCNFKKTVLPYIEHFMQSMKIGDHIKCLTEIAHILQDRVSAKQSPN